MKHWVKYPNAKMRACLGILPNGKYCRRVFLSEGYHNRLCPKCNRRNGKVPLSNNPHRAESGSRAKLHRHKKEDSE